MNDRRKSHIKYVNWHAHSCCGSPFDALGFPKQHLEYAWENGLDGFALTDHGNANGHSYLFLDSKKMTKEGKSIKPLWGVEAYFIPSVKDWTDLKTQTTEDKKKKKEVEENADEIGGAVVENEAETKKKKDPLKRRSHLVLLAQNQKGLSNLYQLVSKSFRGNNFYRFPRIDLELLKQHNEGLIVSSACLSGESLLETNVGKIQLKEVVKKVKNGESIFVLSYNEEKQKLEFCKVLWADKTKENTEVIKINLKNGKNLTLTKDHKVFTNNGWKEAGSLTKEDKVFQVECEFIEIESIETSLKNEDVFDITVEQNHNFFANDVLVHNCLGGTMATQYWEHLEEGEEAILNGMRESCSRFLEIFKDRFYLELQWNAIPHQHHLNNYIIRVAQEMGIELISTTDSHYPRPELWKDRLLYKELGWLNYKNDNEKKSLPSSVNDVGYELYPKNGDQMWQDYKKYSALNGISYDDDLIMGSIERTHKVAFETIENFYPETSVKLPDFVVPEGRDANQVLKEKCYFGLAKLGINNLKYNERLDYELGVIARNGFSKYFLTMDAIHQEASRMVLTGPGRGSSAGALISYSLGICQTDPVKWGLLFERFLTTPPASGYAVVGKELGGVKAKVNKVVKVEIELDDGTPQTLFLTEDLAKGLEQK